MRSGHRARVGAGPGAIGLVWAMTACAPAAEDDRAAWLRNTLTEDHRELLARDPELVAGKYAKMSLSAYDYFRGTLPQFVRDAAERSEAATPYAGEAWSVLLIGDPHPENIGTSLAGDGRVWVDFNDFDAARYGPYHFDLWRLGQGFEVLLRQTEGVSEGTRADAARALVRGYVSELDVVNEGGVLAVDGSAGRVLDDLVVRATRDGRRRAELEDAVELGADGVRRLIRGERTPREDPRVIADELGDAEPSVAWLGSAIAGEWPRTWAHPSTVSVSVLDVARRWGAGVSSYPLARYDLLLEGPTADASDDIIVEAKEIRDPPALRGLSLLPARRYPNDAARVVDAARRLQLYPDEDPLLGWVARGSYAFLVRDRTKYQKGFDARRLAEKWAAGEWVAADVVAFAAISGRLLGRAHGRLEALSDRAAHQRIRAAIGEDRDRFVDDSVEAFARWGDRSMTDYSTFRSLLDTHGALLGARP